MYYDIIGMIIGKSAKHSQEALADIMRIKCKVKSYIRVKCMYRLHKTDVDVPKIKAH